MKKSREAFFRRVILVFCVVILTSCGVTPKKPVRIYNTEEILVKIDQNESLKKYPLSSFDLQLGDKSSFIQELKGHLTKFDVNQWHSKPMDYKGKLAKKWVLRTNGQENIDINVAQSLPEGWRIDAYAEKSITNDMIIDPSTGKPIKSIKFGTNMISTWLFVNNYIFAEDDVFTGALHKIALVDRSNWNKCWVNGWLGMDHHIMIVDGCLLDGNFGPVFDIQRFDASTGGIVWDLNKSHINDKNLNSYETNFYRLWKIIVCVEHTHKKYTRS